MKIKALADVSYELRMMADCAFALSFPFAPEPPLLESLLLHVRALWDFFEKNQRGKVMGVEQDDVLAKDYNFPAEDLGLPRELRNYLNKDLAHLSYSRSGPIWRFGEFLPPIVRRGLRFSNFVLSDDGKMYLVDKRQRELWHETEEKLRRVSIALGFST